MVCSSFGRIENFNFCSLDLLTFSIFYCTLWSFRQAFFVWNHISHICGRHLDDIWKISGWWHLVDGQNGGLWCTFLTVWVDMCAHVQIWGQIYRKWFWTVSATLRIKLFVPDISGDQMRTLVNFWCQIYQRTRYILVPYILGSDIIKEMILPVPAPLN